MKILIQSPPGQLPYLLTAQLEDRGYAADLDPSEAPERSFGLYHGREVTPKAIASLLEAIKPFAPSPYKDEGLAGDTVRLVLPMQEAGAYQLHISADSNQQLLWLQDEVAQGLGLDQSATKRTLIEANEIHYGSAPAWLRQAIRFVLHKKGNIQVRDIKKFSNDDTDIYLQVRDPLAEKRPLKERVKVAIVSDDAALADTFRQTLVDKGFDCLPVSALDPDDLDDCFLGLRTAWIDFDYPLQDISEVKDQLKVFAINQGVDFERYPVTVNSQSDELDIKVLLPIRACRERRLRPYAGPFPERFSVKVLADQQTQVDGLVQRLEALQFKSVSVAPLEKEELVKGFRVGWNADRLDTSVDLQVRQQLRDTLDKAGLERFPVAAEGKFSMLALGNEEDIIMAYPIGGAQDGQLEAEMTAPSNFNLKIAFPDITGWEPFVEKLRAFRFQTFRTEADDVDAARIHFGMAPEALVDKIAGVFEGKVGLEFEKKQQFSATDDDIYLFLPAWDKVAVDTVKKGISPATQNVEAWLNTPGPVSKSRRQFIARQGSRIRVGDIWLAKRPSKPHPLAPAAELFRHYCIDGPTAETLRHIALSFQLREPCLLEGETSTSKTSGVLYLAHLLGQPVFRLNLSGQTDTGDLVGRFVPDDGSHGSGKMGWRWQDGMAVQALKTGAVLLLDEVNTPRDPSIPERLNSLLEDPPSLTLAEKDNHVHGPMGDPVHPMFRIAGTMNPARYAGRSSLSPAWRDRWRASRFVPQPGEVEYRQMLHFLVFGKQPAVRCQGLSYRGYRIAAPMPKLAQIEGIEEILASLASIHTALQKAFDGHRRHGTGSRRTDPVTFTRRGLLSVMEYLHWQWDDNASGNMAYPIKQALFRYYLQRIADDAGQLAVIKTFEAFGIGPEMKEVACA